MKRQPQTRIGEWYNGLSKPKQVLLNGLIAVAGILLLAYGKLNNYF
jgi:hypothetical protein